MAAAQKNIPVSQVGIDNRGESANRDNQQDFKGELNLANEAEYQTDEITTSERRAPEQAIEIANVRYRKDADKKRKEITSKDKFSGDTHDAHSGDKGMEKLSITLEKSRS